MYPCQKQWELLKVFEQHPQPMTPLQFLSIWSDLSYAELAAILGVSISSVEHFMSDSSAIGHRECSYRHCRKLAIVNLIWQNYNLINSNVIKIWCNNPSISN